MTKISDLSPGTSEFSIFAKVLEIKSNEKILKAKICDKSAIAYLLAWDKEKEKTNFKESDTIKITNGLVSSESPYIIVTQDTKIEVLDTNTEEIKTCDLANLTKFIDEIPEFGCCYVEAFIVRIFDIYKYYCKRCKKYSTEVCSCGNFSDKMLIITGMISDSTKTILFETEKEEISKKLMNIQHKPLKLTEEQKRELIKNLFKKKHKFFGYLHNEKFFVAEV